EGRNSATIGFTGPMIEHKILRAEPRAALEMPLKIVVRELDHGEVEIIYYQPSYLFKHYENKDLDKLSREMDILFGSIIKEATKSDGQIRGIFSFPFFPQRFGYCTSARAE
ncbi:MAG: DUF302 domain-containing protein, partial [Candidatus Aenigmarchaeota archaeon]|nr:DUF302 domain-containing protein [Candidatus Aenigmarchaeota archaeon]